MEFSALLRGMAITSLSTLLTLASVGSQQAHAQAQPSTAQMPWMNNALSPGQRADLV